METPDVFCLAVSTRAKWSKFPRELGDRGHKVRGRLGTEAKAANPEFSRDRDLAWEDFPLFYLQKPFSMAVTNNKETS